MHPGRRYCGAFSSDTELLQAARALRERGVEVDAVTPHPVHGLDEVLGLRPSRLPFVTLAGGAAGLSLALWFQNWTSSTNWPLNVGGKPFDSLPAFVPVAFELLVLFAGLSTAAMFLLRSGLLPGKTAHSTHARDTDDQFVLVAQPQDAAVTGDEVEALWQRFGATETWTEFQK